MCYYLNLHRFDDEKKTDLKSLPIYPHKKVRANAGKCNARKLLC